MIKYIKLIIAIILNVLFWRGIYDNLRNGVPNKCEMTYMYEYPQYVEVKLKNISTNNYKLFAYGEGQYSVELSRGIFKGIPVLFIPGNQGSYKQVRSLASVAYRKAQNGYRFHFNYFSVDFNEEIGALYGPVLEQQTHFVGLAIHAILGLYKKAETKPRSVVLVGHSIGGLVARAVVGLSDVVAADSVSILITLATPHTRPVVIPDPSLLKFYQDVDRLWRDERSRVLKYVVFASVGGGRSDIQVPSGLAASPFADVEQTLSSVPLSWLTTDHLAIVWCKQLVLALNRALFQSVDSPLKMISADRERITHVLNQHLVQRTGDEHWPMFSGNKVPLDNWQEVPDLQYSEVFERLTSPKLVAVPVLYDKEHQYISILFTGPHAKARVFACQATIANDSITLSSEVSLSSQTRLLPGNRKEATLDLLTLHGKGYTHIVAAVYPSREQFSVDICVIDGESSVSSLAAPPSFWPPLAAPVTPVPSTPPGSILSRVLVRGWTGWWRSVRLRLEPVGDSPGSRVCGLPVVVVRGGRGRKWEYLGASVDSPYEFSVALDTSSLPSSPPLPLSPASSIPLSPASSSSIPSSSLPPPPDSDESIVEINIIKSPSCSYSVSLENDLRVTLSRVSLLCVPQVPAAVAAQLLLLLSHRYKTGWKGGECWWSILVWLSPISVVPLAKLMAFGLSKLPESVDWYRDYLERTRVDTGPLPLLVFYSALPLTLGAALVIRGILGALAGSWDRTTHMWGPKPTPRAPLAPSATSALGPFSFSTAGVSVALLSLGASTCGTLALVLASGIYLGKVMKMQLARLPSRRKNVPQNETEPDELTCQDRSFDLHFTLCLLTVVVAALNAPSLVTWAKGLRSQIQLANDPSFYPSSVVILSLAVLWHKTTFRPKKLDKLVAYAVHFAAIVVTLYGPIYLYRVTQLICCTLGVVALHQLCVRSC